ncbi:lactose 3-dehydrogenase subunit gamma LacC [soil metagenome]
MNRREALQRAGLVLGYAVSAPVLAGILNGCKATPELTYTPVFFNQSQAGIVSEVAQIIIPKTDTPGAKEVGVPGFIDQILRECYKKEDQDRFMTGLTAFDEGAKSAYGDSFLDLDAAKQEEYVRKVHEEAIKAKINPKERPFILMTKELTVIGFFTSEVGATQVLQYEPVPGAFHGCLPLSEVKKTWATT